MIKGFICLLKGRIKDGDEVLKSIEKAQKTIREVNKKLNGINDGILERKKPGRI